MTMKTRKCVLPFLLALLLICSAATSGRIVAYADAMEGTISTEVSTLNELTARATIRSYFAQREDFLAGTSTRINDGVPGITADENAHLSQLADKGVRRATSEIAINSLTDNGGFYLASVTETVMWLKDNQTISETVLHNLTVYPYDGGYLVGADSYREDTSSFVSASYVPENTNSYTPNASGSSMRIVNVAANEIEEFEFNADGSTKYGHHVGQPYATWCGAFAVWCAHEVGIFEEDVPCVAHLHSIYLNFATKGRFYYSNPQVGDFVFTGTSLSSNDTIEHVAIVTGISNGELDVISGNWSNSVTSHKYNITATDILGYGRPPYGSSHVYGTTYQHSISTHWQVCSFCKHETSKASHSMRYSYNSTKHWLSCPVCNYQGAQANHIFSQPSTGGLYTCACGYQTTGVILSFGQEELE